MRLLRFAAAVTGRRRVWLVVLAVAIAGIATLAATLFTGHSAATTDAAGRSLSAVRRGSVTQTVSAAGTVQAASTRGLSFSVSGTVTAVNVRPGDSVTAGQTLATIDNADEQSAVDSAQTAVDSATNALAKAEATTSPAAPSAGGCQAPAAYTSASPSATTTPSRSASPAPTIRASTIPGRDGRTGAPASTADTGGTGATACAAQGGNAATGTNTRGGTADSLLSAQQQLTNAKLALTQAEQSLAGTVITAPTTGRVLSVAGAVGNNETPDGNGFIVLGGTNDTEVSASFTETDVAQLAVGQPATITLPSRSATPYAGKVSQVSPVGAASNQLVRYSVLIAFDKPPADLLYGQSADVAVTTRSVSNVLYVSSTAVTDVHGDTATVEVRAGGRDERRTVHIGLLGDRYTEITSGLSQGESVVIGPG